MLKPIAVSAALLLASAAAHADIISITVQSNNLTYDDVWGGGTSYPVAGHATFSFDDSIFETADFGPDTMTFFNGNVSVTSSLTQATTYDSTYTYSQTIDDPGFFEQRFSILGQFGATDVNGLQRYNEVSLNFSRILPERNGDGTSDYSLNGADLSQYFQSFIGSGETVDYFQSTSGSFLGGTQYHDAWYGDMVVTNVTTTAIPAIPEPSTYGMLAAGLLLMFFRAGKKPRKLGYIIAA